MYKRQKKDLIQSQVNGEKIDDATALGGEANKESALRFKLLTQFLNFYKNKMNLSNTAESTDLKNMDPSLLPITADELHKL